MVSSGATATSGSGADSLEPDEDQTATAELSSSKSSDVGSSASSGDDDDSDSQSSSTSDAELSVGDDESENEQSNTVQLQAQRGCVGWFIKETSRLHTLIFQSFYRVGGVVFDRSKTIIGTSVLLAVIGIVGLLLTIDIQRKSERIWVPQDSESINLRDRITELWGKDTTACMIIAQARNGGDALRHPVLQEILEIHRRVTELTAETDEGDRLTFENTCKVAAGATTCSFSNPLLWWDMNRTTVSNDLSLHTTLDANPFVLSSDGLSLVPRDQLFKQNSDGSTKSMLAFWLLSGEKEERRLAFEKAFLEMMESIVSRSDKEDYGHPDGFLRESEVLYYAERSLDDELARAIGGDTILFVGAIVAMFVYASLVLSRWNWRETKFTVALGGTLSVCLAIGTSFGFASALGIMFTSITSILPFLLVGIGLDDMFVLVDAIYYQRVWPKQLALLNKDERTRTLRAQFCQGMAEAGAAITVTSLANASAFFLSATTIIPAPRAFALYAGFGVLFDFFFQVTFFAAIAAIDVRRMADNRVDIFPVMHVTVGKEADQDLEQQATKDSFTRRLLLSYSKFLMKTPVRIAVLGLFFILTILGALGASQLETGLPRSDLAPDGSYAATFQLRIVEDFGGYPIRLSVLFDEEGFDYSPLETQKGIEDMTVELEQSDRGFGDKRATFSWFRALPMFVNATAPDDLIQEPGCPFLGCVQPDVFYSHLRAFLADASAIVFREGSVELHADPGTTWSKNSLIAARFLIAMKGSGDEAGRVEIMRGIKDIQDKYREERRWPVSCHTGFFVFVEGDLIQVQEALLSISCAVLAVTIVATALLVHPALGGYVALTLIMVDTQLFGWMLLTDVRFNIIAVTNLTMAIGLSFDFIGHIAHGYIDNKFTDRIEKVCDSVQRLGVPVLHGGMTTLLGVMFLAFAGSVVFRVFFKMIAGLSLLSIIHALGFLPVLLSFVGPQLSLPEVTTSSTARYKKAINPGDQGIA